MSTSDIDLDEKILDVLNRQNMLTRVLNFKIYSEGRRWLVAWWLILLQTLLIV